MRRPSGLRAPGHDVLEHPTRAELYEAIHLLPGAHMVELARIVGVARSTAVYHLHLMARAGLVVQVASGKSVHCYPNTGGAEALDRPRMAVLSSGATRVVAFAVTDSPRLTREGLAEGLRISPSTLSWHLRKLFQHHLVVEERPLDGGPGRLHPTPELQQLLDAWAACERGLDEEPRPEEEPGAGPAVVPRMSLGDPPLASPN